MEKDVSPSNLSNTDIPGTAQSSRSSSIMIVSRQALLDKIDQLKKRWNIGMQSAWVFKLLLLYKNFLNDSALLNYYCILVKFLFYLSQWRSIKSIIFILLPHLLCLYQTKIGTFFSVGTLLDEVNEDIAPHLAEILTKKWYLFYLFARFVCMVIEHRGSPASVLTLCWTYALRF